MPDMNTILAVSKVCKEHNIEVVIDVRDLRPEAFKVLLRNEAIYKIATYPMKVKADKAYACADKLFAVSEEYLQRGTVDASHAKIRKAIYIGAVIDKFDDGVKKYSPEIKKPENEIWLTYAGTLGTSYDLITVIDAANELKDKEYGGKKIKLIVLGQGPDREAFEAHAKEIGATNIEFVGFKQWEEIKELVGKAKFSVIPSEWYENNPLSVIEAKCLGTPVLGARIGGIPELIEEGATGMTFESRNVDDLKDKIQKMWNTSWDYEKIAHQSQERYNAEKYYEEIMKIYKS
jgi:glycosyltransferase involved in cell wall biosynthesis